jgi:glycosyltransferase involved in cell wall biosynthesis
MKILYVARLFSGLETSFLSGIWKPTGVPTIYNLVEELDRKYETMFIFSAKDSGRGYSSLWNKRKDCALSVTGLTQQIHVLAGIDFFPTWMTRKIAIILRDIRQIIVIILATIRFKPDIIYCDHASVIVAAILARYQGKIPIVFRAMGVYPFMRKSLTPSNVIHYIYRWAYYSPFDLVICTQDGSGVESWLHDALRIGVKREILLNGTSKVIFPEILDKKLQSLSKKKNIILFVGKLEKHKGCYDFVESILLLLKERVVKVHALVVGTGSEERELKELVEKSHFKNNFTFIDRLSHNQIAATHKISDIYVSMNRLGNLSNANLEAIQANDCMVIPQPQPETGVDIITNTILSGAVVNVPINNPKYLADILDDLIQHKKKRLKMSREISLRKLDFLWTWEERIDTEISLLEGLVILSED